MSFDLHGSRPNVHLDLSDSGAALAQRASNAFVDLVELATYLFAAEQTAPPAHSTERRRYEMHVPVRSFGLWTRPEVTETLAEVLSLLTGDDYDFAFVPFPSRPSVQLDLGIESAPRPHPIDSVLLFTEDVDALAGVVRATLVDREHVALVSHRTTARRCKTVDTLVESLTARAAPHAVWHLPLWATSWQSAGRELVAKSRSFLYASVAAMVASSSGLEHLHIYENGVASLHVTSLSQSVTTGFPSLAHPAGTTGLARLFSLVLDKPFTLRTPFLWNTKAELLQLLQTQGCSDLLPSTRSCQRPLVHRSSFHCGSCPGCLERRFAMLAAGLDDHDPARSYQLEPLLGERRTAEERTVARTFVHHARQFQELEDDAFFRAYPEADRVLRYLDLEPDDGARRLLELHHRHGNEILAVLARGVRDHAEALVRGHAPSSLLAIALADGHHPDRNPNDGRDVGEPPKISQGGPPLLQREGDFWRLEYAEETALLEDSRGLRYLARLVATPGRPWHATELLAAEAGEAPAPAMLPSSITDPRSLAAYRRRLDTLEDEILDAHQSGNAERLLELREEAEHLERHRACVTGLGGSPRSIADEGERARKAAGNAIARAMVKIAEHHPSLWRHLRQHLRTGTFCFYQLEPEP